MQVLRAVAAEGPGKITRANVDLAVVREETTQNAIQGEPIHLREQRLQPLA